MGDYRKFMDTEPVVLRQLDRTGNVIAECTRNRKVSVGKGGGRKSMAFFVRQGVPAIVRFYVDVANRNICEYWEDTE